MLIGGTGECPAAVGGARAQSGFGAIVGCGVGRAGAGAAAALFVNAFFAAVRNVGNRFT
jgi:hypothetical protein